MNRTLSTPKSNYQNKDKNQSNLKQNNEKQKQKQSIHKQLRILDYRNGKYQGHITQNHKFQRNGTGVMIDDNYSFILSQWKNNNIQGPFFIVYPDQSILYGYINDKKIGSIVCYQINNQFNMILSKNSNIVIVDLLSSRSIISLKVSQKLLDQQNFSIILQMLSQQQKDKQISKGIELISQDSYTNIQQKYKIYQQRLSISNIPEYLKDYQSFIMKYFNANNGNNNNNNSNNNNTNNIHNQLLQIVKTKQQFNISFKKCSLTLFLKLGTNSKQTKIMGSMNKYENDYQFYKKLHHSANMVQQFTKSKQSQNIEYSIRPYNRPLTCKLSLKQFHKRSLTHINEFINIQYIYQIKQNLYKIQQIINKFITNKIAQIQLQSIANLNNNQKNQQNQLQAMNYTLKQVQQEIYDAIQRKKQNSGKKPILNNSYSQILAKSTFNNKSAGNLLKKQINPSINKQKQYNFTKNNSPYKYKKTYNQDNIIQSRLNKSKTNLNISQINHKNSNIKASPVKTSFFNKRQNQTTNTKKYAYLDDVQDNPILTSNKKATTPVKYQGYSNNMKRLTQDFQNIKKQIQLNTPRKKKFNPIYYKHDNQVYQNNSNKYRQTDYTIRQRTTDNITPLSQKKVFRYLPS